MNMKTMHNNRNETIGNMANNPHFRAFLSFSSSEKLLYCSVIFSTNLRFFKSQCRIIHETMATINMEVKIKSELWFTFIIGHAKATIKKETHENTRESMI